MNWIYHFQDIRTGTEEARTCKIYFRPTIVTENGVSMAGNMYIFNVYAMEYVMDKRDKISMTEEQVKEVYRIYFECLNEKDYFFDVEWKPKGHEYYLRCAGTWYMKVQSFTEKDLLEWIKLFMQIHNDPFTSFQKAKYNDFLDENPVMRALQKAAREGKDMLGKEPKDKDQKKSPKSKKNTEGGKKDKK